MISLVKSLPRRLEVPSQSVPLTISTDAQVTATTARALIFLGTSDDCVHFSRSLIFDALQISPFFLLHSYHRPGSNIVSAWWSSSTATNSLSGTSMATPVSLDATKGLPVYFLKNVHPKPYLCFVLQHAAGVAALYLERDPSMTPAEVKAAMLSDGIFGLVSNAGPLSPNIMLSTKNLIGTSDPPSQEEPPNNSTVVTPPEESEPEPAVCKRILQGCTAHNECCSGSCCFLDLDIGIPPFCFPAL